MGIPGLIFYAQIKLLSFRESKILKVYRYILFSQLALSVLCWIGSAIKY